MGRITSLLTPTRLLGQRVESVHDYAGVLIPLEEAHLYSHSARSGRCEFEEAPASEDSSDVVYDADEEEATAKTRRGGDGDDDNDHEGTGMLQMSAAEYTIEGLRREVRKGERGKPSSEYEREFALPGVLGDVVG